MFLILFFVLALCALGLKKVLKNRKRSIQNKHIVITGGSSGIGKCMAVLAAKEGAHVTIIARNVDRLKLAESEVKKACYGEDQIVTSLSLDVSNHDVVLKEFGSLEQNVGPIYGLINCAGMAICGRIEDATVEDINTLINVNLLGTLYPTKTIVAKLKERKEGFIVITASQAALMGIYGMSVYSACKFALRGLAEAIDMELRPYNVQVTLALPPDTDTPGFENENKTKPIETKLISESGGLYKPEEVADKILRDTLNGKFFSFIGFESAILSTLCIGMSPFTSWFEIFLQAAVLGPLRIVGAFYLLHFNRIMKKCVSKDIKKTN